MKYFKLTLFSVLVLCAQARGETIKGITFFPASAKIDFADLESRAPADTATLSSWTAADLRKLNQEQLDQLYARLRPGSAPVGAYQGRVIQFAAVANVSGLRAQLLRSLAASLWSGKVFETIDDQLIAKSLVPAGLVNRGVMKAAAMAFTGRDPDFSAYKQVEFLNGKSLEVLPSKVFIGQSLLDSRHESYILDFSFADTVPNFHADFDSLATKKFLEMRDEMREVHPGLYLGRAYIHQALALSFVLWR